MVRPAADWTERSHDLSRLLARAGLGDRAAFATLYERTSSHLFAVVLRINRDRAQAEDILQEVYVNVWRAASSFDAAQSQPLTWLTSIARNRAIDSLRRDADPAPDAQPPAPPTDGRDERGRRRVRHRGRRIARPARSAEPGRRRRARSPRAWTSSRAQQRQSVALAFFQGLSHAEVATQMRQPLGTVKSWVRRSLLTLKSCLDGAVQRDARAARRLTWTTAAAISPTHSPPST